MTEANLLSLIAPRWRAAREKGSAPAAIGVHSDTRWQGPAEVTLDSVRVPVAQCDSVLAAREQLAVRGSNWFVLVTPLELTDLGADVEARLLRHRLLRVEPWDLLRSRFNARTFDGSLLGKAALADAAVEALGATNPDPAPAGVLTAESVWRVVIGNRLGVDEARPDARKWLEWAQDAAACARWRALGDELKGLLVDWMAGSLGDWANAFAGCLDSGYGQQARRSDWLSACCARSGRTPMNGWSRRRPRAGWSSTPAGGRYPPRHSVSGTKLPNSGPPHAPQRAILPRC